MPEDPGDELTEDRENALYDAVHGDEGLDGNGIPFGDDDDDEDLEVDGMSLVSLTEKRLGSLRQLEGPLDEAIRRFRDTVTEHKATDDEYRSYQWQERDADHVVDPDLEAAGEAARAALKAAADDLVAVQAELSATIGQTIASGGLMVGDEIRTPSWEHRLTVAVMFQPSEISLSEATLTGDGGPATHQWHSPKLDETGAAIPDSAEPVRFERWSQNGLRVGGWVHPISRGPVLVD